MCASDVQRLSEANRSTAISSLLSYLRLLRPPQGNRRADDGRKVRGSRLTPSHVSVGVWVGAGGGSLRCHADFLLQSGTSKERLSEEGGHMLVFECYCCPLGRGNKPSLSASSHISFYYFCHFYCSCKCTKSLRV